MSATPKPARRRSAVILLHGWPYDIHSFADVAPFLAGGLSRDRPVSARLWHDAFSFERHFRNGQPSAVAVDIVAFMDALKIEKAIWPVLIGERGRPTSSRCYGRSDARPWFGERLPDRQPGAGKVPLPPKAEFQWWYQYYFATERGRAGYDKYRRDFAKLIWQQLRRNGTSMTRRSIAARPRSTIRIMSAS